MKWYKKDQHFLIDNRVIDRILEYADLIDADTVLEIGAGYGNLTQELAAIAGKVTAIEVDADLAQSISNFGNVDLIVGDALKIEFPKFNKVVSNLPYSISSPITFKLLEQDFDFAILMYQYEFAKRMVALPGTKDYGRLTIAVQYYSDVEMLEIVPPSAFNTPPDVKSAIIRMTPRPPPYKVKDREFFMKFITAAFSQRRKKLRNALLNNANLLGIRNLDAALKKLPDELMGKRAETITPQGLAELADALFEEKG